MSDYLPNPPILQSNDEKGQNNSWTFASVNSNVGNAVSSFNGSTYNATIGTLNSSQAQRPYDPLKHLIGFAGWPQAVVYNPDIEYIQLQQQVAYNHAMMRNAANAGVVEDQPIANIENPGHDTTQAGSDHDAVANKAANAPAEESSIQEIVDDNEADEAYEQDTEAPDSDAVSNDDDVASSYSDYEDEDNSEDGDYRPTQARTGTRGPGQNAGACVPCLKAGGSKTR